METQQNRSENTAHQELTPAEDALTAARLRELNEVLSVVAQAVEMDGGSVELISADTVDGVVHVRLSGACGSCSVAGTTLDDGVSRVLRQRLDWVREVRGDVEASDVVGRGGWRSML